jgi:glycosyltransferase involved in cell wall biosynthesis
MKFNVIIERLLPQGTRRREYFDLGLKGCRIAVNEGISKVISEYKKRREWKRQLLHSRINTIENGNIPHDANSKTSEMEKYIHSIFSIPEKSQDFVPSSKCQVSLPETDIKLIAFYLPQFHPIPENDLWWGKGFTEWTNVTKTVPQFTGHYQPRLPDGLGFYDLTNPDIQKRQIELAKHYGLSGFCFHYYWFNGKRLLEKPLNNYIEHIEFDFPFCICWANENWTRRWDGMEHEVLMAQEHSSANNTRFIDDLFPLLQDPRYIKIEGKPLIIIYRAMLLPDVKKMVNEWREYCRGKGIIDLYIIAASTFGFNEDPQRYGIDAIVEFPPHFMPGCPDITGKFTIMNEKFDGQIWDYEQFVKSKNYLGNVPYTLYKGICPGWDNTARKPNNPTIYHGANPKLYGEWLSDLIMWTRKVHKQDERFIFINAWNEWAEGAYLEPDRKYGFGYLEATRDALGNPQKSDTALPDPFHQIKEISDNDWLRMLLDSVQKPSINGIKMPGFPPDQIQKQFVGSSYENALKEGFNFYRLIKKYAEKYGISIDPKTKILDFGCGWGRITRILLKDFTSENIFAVDVDPSIISVCKETIDGIDFTACNPSAPLQFLDDSFDIIYAYSVFSHLSEDCALPWIQEFSRILKPGGILLATTQSSRFLDFCQSVRDNNLNGGWYDSLKVSFTDIHRCRTDYENGTFLFSPTGGGDYREKTFYGEAIISKKYIQNKYAEYLQPVEFIDDERVCPQALFILQKKMNFEENPDIKNNIRKVSDIVTDNLLIKKKDKKIIVVSHDAHLWGAQLLALHITKTLKENFHYDVSLILKSGGRLEEDFKKYSTVYNLERDYSASWQVDKLIKKLSQNGANIAICNTVVTGDIVELLVKNNIKTISLIHELPGIIQEYKQEENARAITAYADKVVFPAEIVKSKFVSISGLDNGKCVISPQGLYLKNSYKSKKDKARIVLRKLLAIPQDSKIILAVGHADKRKGVDLFFEVAKKVLQSETGIYFIWTGHRNENFVASIDSEIKQCGLEDHIRFVGIQKDVDLFYAGSDLYLMTSREDPFPSTILEAMDVGVPVIGFKDAGGFGEIITPDNGMLVPYLDVDTMTKEVIKIISDPENLHRKGECASALIKARYNFVDYIYRLLTLLGCEYKKVSVVVPNYNYAQYLEERLASIVKQGYPIYEIIFLDDCSSDNSLEIASRYAEKCRIPFIIYQNIKNSGSVFRQWARGILEARGDFIWIAEADDLCETTFLEKVVKGIKDEHVVMSYCNSKQIDDCGNFIGVNYLDYTNDIDENKWKNNYTREGIKEICDTLVIKNTIPNVSATVFKKCDISEILDDLVQFRIAGDWFFYTWLLQKGEISFIAESLNDHRRHSKGVTLSEDKERHFKEIVKMQDYIIKMFNVNQFTLEKVLKYRNFVKEYLITAN